MSQKKTVGSYEAKTNLSQLLELVAKGESITITRRGKPIAILSPADPSGRESLDDVVSRIRDLRKSFKLGGAGLKKLIQDGRE